MVFVLAGLAFKIAAVPFHMWTPDVYEGSPTPVICLLRLRAQGGGDVRCSVRVAVEALGPATDGWRQIVIFVALVLDRCFGGVAAIGQSNIKRLLAYSSINNVGFALFGLVRRARRRASRRRTDLHGSLHHHDAGQLSCACSRCAMLDGQPR